MRVVAPVLSMKIATVSLGPALFRLETLLRCPRFDERPVHGEVLVGHVALSPLQYPLEEAPRRLLVEQSIPVLREHGGIPHPLVHVHPHEPSEQQVVVQLLHQQPLTADRVEDLQQQRPQQPFRSNRRPSRVRIQPRKVARHLFQHFIHQRPNLSQRVIGRHSLLRRHVAEHPILLLVLSSHTNKTIQSCFWLPARRVFQQAPRWLSNRPAAEWALIHTDEVYFRDTANGFLAWAVALVACRRVTITTSGSSFLCALHCRTNPAIRATAY